MEQEDKWTRFAATGKIQDYLSYKQARNMAEPDGAVSNSSREDVVQGISRGEKEESYSSFRGI